MRQVLVVVDYQNDFVTGALANPAAQALEQGIVQKVQAVLAVGGRVLFTRDTHGGGLPLHTGGPFSACAALCARHTGLAALRRPARL